MRYSIYFNAALDSLEKNIVFLLSGSGTSCLVNGGMIFGLMKDLQVTWSIWQQITWKGTGNS